METNSNKLEYYKEYYQKTKVQRKEYRKINQTKRNKTLSDLEKIKKNIRTLTYMSFRRYKEKKYVKGKKTEHILGCTLDQFVCYIQSLFTEGMTLENQGKGPGKWNIDHITPISSAQTEEEIYKLNHYTNLQPLWWEDNIKKFNH